MLGVGNWLGNLYPSERIGIHLINPIELPRNLRLLALLLYFVPLAANAHLGSIRGVVTNGGTNRPLRGVTGQLVGLENVTLTDVLSRFRFDKLVALSYKVEFSPMGYAPFVLAVTIADDQTASIQTRLTGAR